MKGVPSNAHECVQCVHFLSEFLGLAAQPKAAGRKSRLGPHGSGDTAEQVHPSSRKDEIQKWKTCKLPLFWTALQSDLSCSLIAEGCSGNLKKQKSKQAADCMSRLLQECLYHSFPSLCHMIVQTHPFFQSVLKELSHSEGISMYTRQMHSLSFFGEAARCSEGA